MWRRYVLLHYPDNQFQIYVMANYHLKGYSGEQPEETATVAMFHTLQAIPIIDGKIFRQSGA